jgi:hypothetical protein
LRILLKFKIIKLNWNYSFYNYVNIPKEISEHPNFNDTPRRFADMVRLYTLTEHGGVWIDPSTLLKEPLDNWLFPKYAKFSGFYNSTLSKSDQTPIIETCLMACNKGCTFMKYWKDEFLKMTAYPNVEKYIEYQKKIGVEFENMYDPIESAVYISAQKVLQLDKYPMDSFILRKIEEGPTKYLVEAKGDPDKALNLACFNKGYQSPLIYFNDECIRILEQRMDYDFSNEKCGWLD